MIAHETSESKYRIIAFVKYFYHSLVSRTGLQCEFCDQSYKYRGDLNRHLRSHLGGKIYKCDQCDERFKFKFDLQKHSYQHYKEQTANSQPSMEIN